MGIAGRYNRYPMFEAREVVFGDAFRQESVLFAGIQDAGFGRDVQGMLAAGCLTTMLSVCKASGEGKPFRPRSGGMRRTEGNSTNGGRRQEKGRRNQMLRRPNSL